MTIHDLNRLHLDAEYKRWFLRLFHNFSPSANWLALGFSIEVLLLNKGE